MSWLAVALIAYLLLAVVNLLDKFLVDRVLPSSRAYAFAACIFGLFVFLIAPWFLTWPGWALFILNIINGGIFAAALWLLYESLRRGEAARVLVTVGGLTPVFSLAFSLLFFEEQFSGRQWAGLAAVLAGVAMIAFLPVTHSYLHRFWSGFQIFSGPDFRMRGIWFAVGAALAYSAYFLSTKQAYGDQAFLSAFLWTRLGSALFVLLFLIRSSDRAAIRSLWAPARPGAKRWLIVLNQGLGSLGFILQNYAVFLGSVVLVNALQGTQYAFILIMSTILAVMAPRLLKETFSWNILLRKAAAVAAIAAGLYLIAL